MKAKASALRWLRLEKRCAFIATEVGTFSADALGINEKRMIEVEIKISIQDFKADFRKPKHSVYNKDYEMNWGTAWIPNQFYFAVKPEMVEEAKSLLTNRGREKYGLLLIDTFQVAKRAHALHDREPSTKVKFGCALRMGSELIRYHDALI